MEYEKFRGLLTAIISGSCAGGLNEMLLYLGVPVLTSTTISMYIFGNIAAYALDILLAKKKFSNKIISYSDIKFRFQWMLKSFISKMFARFIIVTMVDALIGITILKYLLKKLDEKNIHFKFRNLIASGVVALFTFLLYVNVLRFDWVYKEDTDHLSNLIVIVWASIVIMIFSKMNFCQSKPKHFENT